jgi:acetylornithine deacetylase
MSDHERQRPDAGVDLPSDEPEVVSLTRDLVAVPVEDATSEAGDRIEAWLREHTSGNVLRDAHGNVFARRRTTDGGANGDEHELADAGDVTVVDRPSLALVGHHDVVPPVDEQVADDDVVRVDVVDGRIEGRGTADMKGAVAAALLAFRDAELEPGDADTESAGGVSARDLVFASFVGEEDGGVGCRAAIADGFAPTWAVVGEGSTGYSAPGVTDVAVAHKGRRAVTVTAEGASAHASEPDAGENAIYRATDAVDVLRDVDWPTVDVAGETLAGSVVVTEIDGGSAWNVVPESCEVTVDERTVPGERAAIERVEEIEGVSWRVDQDLPPMRCGDDAFADAVLAAAADTQDGVPELVTKPHATDAGWLADRAGTACVVCGVAEPGEAHTDSESASVRVLERCSETYRAVATAAFD